MTLTIKFAAQGPNNTVVDNPEVYIIKINVKDNTPSQDSSLKSLVIQDQDGDTIPFSNFSPDTLSYTGANTIHIPFKANSITITPTLNDPRGANNPMRFYLKDTMGNVVPIPGHDLESGIGYRVQNGQKSFLIPFYKEGESPNKTEMLGKVYSLFVVAPSQDPRSDFWTTYQLDIVRDPPSTDNTLGSLGIYLEDADPNDAKNNLIQNFDPKQEVYEIWIPYSTKMLRVRANKNDSQAKMDEMKVTDLPKMFVGLVGGSMGEVSAMLLLLGGLFLLWRKVITWYIPVSYIGTVAALTFLFPRGNDPLQWMLCNLLGGGLMLGAIFMATDYVTSPVSHLGQAIFGVGCGLITVFIRYFGSYNEGVCYAILIMNLTVWLIDKNIKPRRFGVTRERRPSRRSGRAKKEAVRK